MKYLLFVFGRTEDPKIFNEITYQVQSITENITNSINRGNALIYYIDSKLNFDDLDFFLLSHLDCLVDFYFLFPANKKFSENLDFKTRDFFFEEDADSIMFSEFEEDDEDEEFDIKVKKNKINDLDNILEKIKSKGIKSLTIEENKFLKTYSK